MKFVDEGIIINIRKYGERSAIAKVFSSKHGIYNGFIKSISSNKSKAIYQVGNLISFEYIARLEENLGQFVNVDLSRSYLVAAMFCKSKLACVNSLFAIIDKAFLERQEHDNLFVKLQNFLIDLNEEKGTTELFIDYIKLELEILKDLGYEIDLSRCAATNSSDNLAFVSPKSGCAVSLEAGKAYENKLLKLPKFLLGDFVENNKEDIVNGLNLSGYFLEKFVFEDKFKSLSPRFTLKSQLDYLKL